MPDAFRVIDYGGFVSASSEGGSALEYWAVTGLAERERQAAHGLGLPKVGDFHTDPAKDFVGTVQDVRSVREFGSLGWLATVFYSTGGTFNFSTRLGARVGGIADAVRLPVISGPGPAYIMPEPFTYITRHGFVRVDSRKYVGNPETVLRVFAKNLNKLYTPGAAGGFTPLALVGGGFGVAEHLQYQLSDLSLVTDAGGNTRVDTYFKHRSALLAFPAGQGPNYGDVNIPALPANSDYVVNVLDAQITTTNPADVFGLGEALPWMV